MIPPVREDTSPLLHLSPLCREQEEKQDRKDARQRTNEGLRMQLRDGMCVHKIMTSCPNMLLFVIFQWFWRRVGGPFSDVLPFDVRALLALASHPTSAGCFSLLLSPVLPSQESTIVFRSIDKLFISQKCSVEWAFCGGIEKTRWFLTKDLSKRKADATRVDLISNQHWKYHKAISAVSVQILSAH